jgi:hypothetical protein
MHGANGTICNNLILFLITLINGAQTARSAEHGEAGWPAGKRGRQGARSSRDIPRHKISTDAAASVHSRPLVSLALSVPSALNFRRPLLALSAARTHTLGAAADQGSERGRYGGGGLGR